MLERLSEADTGVDADPIGRHAAVDGGRGGTAQNRAHLGDHVPVMRVRLHSARLSQHVHQDDAHA